MRTFLIVVVAMLVPFAMYAAGCRQDSAAFPAGPEVKNLAASSVEAQHPTIPYIPPIDPEIASSAESTNARLLAVADRQSRLSGNYEAPGLFVLPPMNSGQNDIMAMAPAAPYEQRVLPLGDQYEPLPEPVPVLTPTAPMPGGQARPEFWSRPMSLQPLPGMQPPPAGYSPMAAPVPVMSGALQPSAPDILTMPESIPGVYLGIDSEPVALSSPPESRPRMDAWALPPPLSSPPALPLAPVVAPAPVASLFLQPWKEPPAADDVKKALEPLSRLAEPANLEMPALFPATLPTQPPSLSESLASARDACGAQPEPAKPVMSARDVYRMDIWDDKVATFGQCEMREYDVPQSIMEYELSRQASTPDEPPVRNAAEMDSKAEQADAPGQLRKIKLRPLRSPSLNAIDAEVAPPPLLF